MRAHKGQNSRCSGRQDEEAGAAVAFAVGVCPKGADVNTGGEAVETVKVLINRGGRHGDDTVGANRRRHPTRTPIIRHASVRYIPARDHHRGDRGGG